MSPAAVALTSFIVYLVVLLAIGFHAARASSANLGEFFIAGRRLNRFVVTISAVVSGRSAWLLLGVSGMAYARGASALWTVAGYTLAEFLLFLFYAPRLRRFAERYDCITIPDFFAARLGDHNDRLRPLLAIITFVFMIAYVAAQLVAGGKAMSASFGMEANTGVLVTAAIVLTYTTMGGFLAVSRTDVFQGILMIVALVVLPVVAVADLGGWRAMMTQLQAFNATMLDPWALSFGALLGFIGIGLGSPGNPHILVRYMAIRDPSQFRFVALVGTGWNVVMGAGAVIVGLAGRVYFPEVGLLPGADTEQLYPLLAEQHLPAVLFGVVVAAIFAAIMSTADSQLLVAASSVVQDVYVKVLRRGLALTGAQLVRYSRVTVVLIVLAALGLGFGAQEIVFWLVLFAWAGLGASFGPTSILALFWRGATRAGVAAGAIAGALTAIVWYYTPALRATLYELIPAFAVGLLVTVAVSRFTRKPDGVNEMFAAMRGGAS